MEPSEYLRLNRVFLLLAGLWKLERKSVLYKIYRTIMVGYFCLYLFRLIVQLCLVVGENENEAIRNAGVSIMCVTSISKSMVCMSSRCAEMIQTIKKREMQILQSGDEAAIKIYTRFTSYNRTILLRFFFCGIIATVACVVAPKLKDSFVEASEIRPLPISVWIPFDPQKHYNAAYLVQSIDGNFGCIFTVATDTFLLSLMIFAVAQLKILNHNISVFNSEEVSAIINDHLCIIKYMNIPF